MQRRTAGVVFICIAAFLYGIRYISAAIFGSNASSWSYELFRAMLGYIGNGPLIASIASLIVGIAYLVASEKDWLKKNAEQIKENWNEPERK
ncbi:hypothetical protein [Cohnella algarum]|uniref:hypothetical protein n=1 Tax=Cohnella algarum TaxID=2044859 RepID=UPI001967E122|nr:hypothetical protein [Cohnella algarum]MBN2984497.1 hypothetical protein [Cohnella algarum]